MLRNELIVHIKRTGTYYALRTRMERYGPGKEVGLIGTTARAAASLFFRASLLGCQKGALQRGRTTLLFAFTPPQRFFSLLQL